MIVRDLLRALRVVRPAVCEDATRYHMHGVLVDLDRRCVVATDGHQLAIVEGIEVEEGDDRGRILLDPADVDVLIKTCRKSTTTDVEIIAERITCGAVSVTRTKRDADTFAPSYWQVLENARTLKPVPIATLGVNVNYLVAAHDGFAAYGVRYGKTETCSFTPVHTFYGDLAPIVITPHARVLKYTPHRQKNDVEVRCPLTWLVMPVRV